MSSWSRSSLIRRLALVCVIAAVVASGVWAIDHWRLRAPERPLTHPVAGKLYVNGVPAGNASIAFHPIGAHAAEIYRPVGRSKADGSFSLMTYAPDDGAPEGEYVVTILYVDPTQPYDECGDVTTHDVLKGRYLDATKSELRARVVPGSNDIKVFAVAENSGGWSNPQARIIRRVIHDNPFDQFLHRLRRPSGRHADLCTGYALIALSYTQPKTK